MIINGYYIVAIILIGIGGYFIDGNLWLLMAFGRYFINGNLWLLMAFGRYFIGGY
jgi:hypothetical protein